MSLCWRTVVLPIRWFFVNFFQCVASKLYLSDWAAAEFMLDKDPLHC